MTRHSVSRRDVLRSGAVVSGAVLSGAATIAGSSVAQERSGLASQIESHGHYAWFPFGPDSWGRSSDPYDFQDGNSRWLAQPADDGGVRCQVENLGTESPNRNAGFDVHLGQIGGIDAITVRTRTVQTQRTTGPASLFVGLYLDKDGNGDFFEWEAADGTESWVGSGGDEEGISFADASGELTVDGDTTFGLVAADRDAATLSELKNGDVEGIDGSTPAALYLGVVNSGDGPEEVVVEDLTVQRG